MGKVIGIDLDGVLYDWHGIIYRHIKYTHGEDYDLKTFWKKAREEKYRHKTLENLVQVPIFYDKKNISNRALNTLNRLADEHSLCYITSRPKIAKIPTERWLERNKIPYRDHLYMVKNKRPTVSLLQCDYFVDDKKEVIDYLRDITNAILFKNNTMDNDYVQGYNYIEDLSELLEVRL